MTRSSVRLNSTKLKEFRLGLGFSQAQLCRQFEKDSVQISMPSIKRVELGKAVSFRIAREIADYYGVLIGTILADDEEPLINLKRETKESLTCLISIRLNDTTICAGYLVDLLREQKAEIVSFSDVNVLCRYELSSLYRILSRIESGLLTQYQDALNCGEIGCSIVIVKEIAEQGNSVLTVDDRDICELSYIYSKNINENILIDKRLYYSICRYFDINVTNECSILGREYYVVRLYANQNYVGDHIPFKQCESFVQTTIDNPRQKSIITITGESGMGKSHWMRYLTSLYIKKLNVSEVECILTCPEYESALIPRTALMICKIIGVNLIDPVEVIVRALTVKGIDFGHLSYAKVSRRIKEILDNTNESRDALFYDDVTIVNALIDYSKIRVVVFDGTYSKHEYYTKVFAYVFSKSKSLRCVVVSTIYAYEHEFVFDNVDSKTFSVPDLTHQNYIELVKNWSDNQIPDCQIDEIIFNSNGNLRILRQMALESIEDNVLTPKIIKLASLKLTELPQQASDLLGLLVVSLEIDCEYSWERSLATHKESAWMLRERGILHVGDGSSQFISHASYISAFKKVTPKECMASYVRQVIILLKNLDEADRIYTLRKENLLYRKIGENNKLLNNIRSLYRTPSTSLIFTSCVADIYDGLRVSCDTSQILKNKISSAIQISWAGVAFGSASPMMMALRQRESRRSNEHEPDTSDVCIFVQLVPLLISLELKQFVSISRSIDKAKLNDRQTALFSAFQAYGEFMMGNIESAEVYTEKAIERLNSFDVPNSRAEQDTIAICHMVRLMSAYVIGDQRKTDTLYSQVESALRQTEVPANQCLMIYAQIYVLFEGGGIESIFDKAMDLYEIASKANIISFQSIAMTFIEWERALSDGSDEHINRFVSHYNNVVINQQFKVFYPFFAIMLAKLQHKTGSKCHRETINYLKLSINFCLAKGCKVYLDRLYLYLEKENQALEEEELAPGLELKAMVQT
ncbi:helix-turn-helix transcriptional regulator [Vibrio tapetis subsp. quintayensis]|uniref:helix-turn-helix domain-containing protein n=1 Tax=Vibrio tapetis TaxID=52443 RepID=UPI0025B62274|nr:helix-turn-helix transcriptional regulator [Vibrio tapetis]MDN3682949.1 helix-turn-helix transcriptional regulator [Vibrio tapetis subsp. quintayensis]